jgi:hypothetical protein
MSSTISMATARLDDSVSMAEFLAAIPDGDQLAKVLARGTPLASRAYDDDAWTARFVATNGKIVKCFTITDITIDQAEMIAAVGSDFVEVDESAFRELVALALGPTFEPAG